MPLPHGGIDAVPIHARTRIGQRGTRGLDSHAIARGSERLMTMHDIPSSTFRSKRITPQIAHNSDLILCFEHSQRREISVIVPTAARKAFLINDFANMCAYCKTHGYIEGETREDRIESVIDNAGLIRPMIPDTNNVEDPNGKDFAVYEAAYNEICDALQTIRAATD